jgi:NTE family protein
VDTADHAHNLVHATLLSLDAYRSASPAAQTAALASARIEPLAAGTVLYRQHDPPSDISVVVEGRLRACRRDGSDSAGDTDSDVAVLGDIGPGEVAGELAALTGGPRSADVVAIRHTVVVRMSTEVFLSLVRSGDEVLRATVARSIDRVRTPASARHIAAPSVVCVVGEPGEATAAHAAVIAEAIKSAGGRAQVVREMDGIEVSSLERSGVIAVLCPDAGALDEIATGVNQADLVVLMWGGRPELSATFAAALDARRRHAAPAPYEVVLRHPGAVRPGWAELARHLGETNRVHHLRQGDDRDLARLGRRLTGTSVGLVISGGGARAFAALGAVRAFRQRGIQIDAVGGSSIGALMSALIATDEPVDELIQHARRVLQRADWGKDFTVPLLSLLSIRKAVPAIEELFGDLDLADTPVPCFVTTVDFSDCRTVVHDSGSASRWVRASASPPGLWPPVIGDDGHVHVDGGVLDNLPVEEMRSRGLDAVIAINVSVAPPFAMPPGTVEARSGLNVLRRRRRGEHYPMVTDLLFRMGIVGSLPAQQRSGLLADLLIRPDVAHHGLADYAAVDSIVAAGERAVQAALTSDPQLVARFTHDLSGLDPQEI